MDNELIKNELNFESIKHIDDNGTEFWYARELMIMLNYKSWRYFEEVIKKSIISCENSNMSIFDHFVVDNKIVEAGATTKPIKDYKLTRYACYLIAQNANPRLKAVALAQTYFAIQTRKQELTRHEYEQLTEDEKRLYTRKNVKEKNNDLFKTAQESGVNNFGKFNNYGYRGLYNGENVSDIKMRKGLKEKEEILDYMGSTELAANLFRITQTDEVLKNKKINNEIEACKTHHDVGQAVRQTIKRIGGTMPEDLPTPEKGIPQLEKEKKQQNKLNKNQINKNLN